MNNMNIFSAVCGVLLTLASTTFAQDSYKPGGATVVRIQGEARYSVDGGQTWTPLVAGNVVTAGAVLQTGYNSYIDVVLGKVVQVPQGVTTPNHISPAADYPVRGLISYRPQIEQNMIRLTANTTLAINKLTISDTGMDTVSDTELDLQKGYIFAKVTKLNGASQYLIKIPNGIAGVRGTFFGLGADGRCDVLQNSVLLSLVGSDGKPSTELVSEGNSFNPATGQISPALPEILSGLFNLRPILTTKYDPGDGISYCIIQNNTFISTDRQGQNTAP
jgi:hypothetical protein